MKKGFTLIELLAVIVILAIIALIATPIVLSIINDSKESATLRSAEFYVDALELSIAQSALKGTPIIDRTYEIKDGDLCIDNECTKKLTPEVKGEKPSSGEVSIKDGKIDEITLVISDKTITKDEKGQLVYQSLKYTIGQQVKFNPGDQERLWNVIGEDATTVTLMLSENLGDTYAWYASEDNSYGPKDALEYLNRLTTEWDNVDPIKNYTYINNLNGTSKPNGYQKLEIKNGVTTLTHKDGTTTKLDETNKTKARILSKEEVFEIAQKTNTNLTEDNLRKFIAEHLDEVNALLQAEGMEVELKSVDEMIVWIVPSLLSLQYESKYYQTYYTVWTMINEYGIDPTHDILLPDYMYDNLYEYGYWTLSSFADSFGNAWFVYYDGNVLSDNSNIEDLGGVRPVITVSKSLPLQTVE